MIVLGNGVYMCIDMDMTGKRIKDMIKTAGFTAKDVADACCLANPNAVWRWQKGINMPTLDNLVVIAKMCGCGLDDLVVVR